MILTSKRNLQIKFLTRSLLAKVKQRAEENMRSYRYRAVVARRNLGTSNVFLTRMQGFLFKLFQRYNSKIALDFSMPHQLNWIEQGISIPQVGDSNSSWGAKLSIFMDLQLSWLERNQVATLSRLKTSVRSRSSPPTWNCSSAGRAGG